ncbi:MMPL family transporter [Thalassotalea psychrophila]|uniref:MMPL family transporter n=1 Tax=Thalassotalea psychrophila TaxID=3065647 RepID=A0ABY9TXD2_9GAMM|nr:MMPL family transporter [Colwelliaceae bacterium SQ149]
MDFSTKVHKNYLNLQKLVGKNQSLIMLSFFILWLAISLGIFQLRYDFSFKPFFLTQSSQYQITQKFEQTFGQNSGSYVIFILHEQNILQPPFVSTLNKLSLQIKGVNGVSQVLSLTTLESLVNVPSQNNSSALKIIPLFSPEIFNNEVELQKRLQQISNNADEYRLLLSKDQKHTLLAVKLIPPLSDLQQRQLIIENIESQINSHLSENTQVYKSGVSVVEATYAEQILIDQLIATTLTTLFVALLIYIVLKQWRVLLIVLTPVFLVIVSCIGVMGWLNIPITIINSVVPAIILVIGVADAIHMILAFLRNYSQDNGTEVAIEKMLFSTSPACFYTSISTAAGFFSLLMAKLVIIQNFGLIVAIAVIQLWLANQILIPFLLRHIALKPKVIDNYFSNKVVTLMYTLANFALMKPYRILCCTGGAVVICLLSFNYINIEQKFNEELAKQHSVRVAQTLLEQKFSGFLGPDISITRVDGEDVFTNNSVKKIRTFITAIKALEHTDSIRSIFNFLPHKNDELQYQHFIKQLRSLPAEQINLTELINADNTVAALQVRISDIGSKQAMLYTKQIQDLAEQHLGSEFKVNIVGQWWLAQQGMNQILIDMIITLCTAFVIIIPIIIVALKEKRLIIIAVLINFLPILIPLAYMAFTGIKVRIGTAVVLAIAIGIVVDNSFHLLTKLRLLAKQGLSVQAQIQTMLDHAGKGVMYTTLALVAGFLSMLSNQLIAINDMGVIASVTFVAALLADILLLPALYSLSLKNLNKKGATLNIA